MIYVTIDTNVYLDILLNQDEYDYNLKSKMYEEIIENKEEDTKDDTYTYREDKLPLTLIPLKSLCENNVVKLILTEVTKLELEKYNYKYIKDIENDCKKLENAINKEKIWNNINYIKNNLKAVLEQNKKISTENWKFGYEKLIEWLELENNLYLSLNTDVICNLYRKNIAGLLGDNQKEVERATKNNDYLFINIIQEYFKDKKLENDYIFLVTKDQKDFRGKRVKDYYELKENFKDDKVEIRVLADIKSLYKLINSDVNIDKEINQKISELLEQRRKNFQYNEESEWNDWISWNDDSIRDDILDAFARKDKSLEEIKLLRKSIIEDIKAILNECRELSSWDNRSELKLHSWLENNSEEDIELLNLSTLLTIKNNLKEYYKIHEEELKELEE